jgi:hypothetical protein
MTQSSAAQPLQTPLVTAYLSNKGWQVKNQGEKSVWNYTDNQSGEIHEIKLPQNIERAEISDILSQLAQLESRSSAVILTELMHADSDLLRVCVRSADTELHSLGYDNSVRLAQGVQRLMAAISWATAEPSPVLTGKKPRQVTDFMQRLRLGQSERDGYTEVIIVPLKEIDQETYSRRVMLTLAGVINQVQRAAASPALINDKESHRELVDHGLSANLCDALARMFGKLQGKARDTRIEFHFAWSPMLSVPQGTPDSVSLEADMVPELQDISARLRETEPQEGFQMRGLVTDLRRTSQDGMGKISVSNAGGESPEKISMELEEELYEIAIQAHRDKAFVMCMGTLVKRSKSFELVDAALSMAEGQPAQ